MSLTSVSYTHLDVYKRQDQLEKGKPLVDAALEGARLRLRPILMTSFAFILGCVPLWIATGAGAVSRQIMGTTVTVSYTHLDVYKRQAEDEGKGSHKNRTKAQPGSFERGVNQGLSFFELILREFDDQNRVLRR